MENNKALLTEAVEDSLPTIADDKLLELAEQAQARVQAIRTIRNAALTITDAHDWIDEKGRPYLQSSGSEKIARVFGISWKFEGEPECKDLTGGHYQYRYKGVFSLSGSSIEAVGIRASNDSFFTTRYVGGNKTTLPGSEVDRANVEKAAYTNCLGNGITRLLGLRNLTWEEISEVTKGRITKDRVTGVQYKTKGKPQKSTTRGQTSTQVDDHPKDEELVEKKTWPSKKAFVENIKSFEHEDMLGLDQYADILSQHEINPDELNRLDSKKGGALYDSLEEAYQRVKEAE